MQQLRQTMSSLTPQETFGQGMDTFVQGPGAAMDASSAPTLPGLAPEGPPDSQIPPRYPNSGGVG